MQTAGPWPAMEVMGEFMGHHAAPEGLVMTLRQKACARTNERSKLIQSLGIGASTGSA